MIDRVVNSMQDSPATQRVLRVFSGPLQGCEFVLAQRRNLFVVGSEAKFCSTEHPLSIPEDAIYIPLECGGSNFEVLLGDNDCSDCVVRILGDEGVIEQAHSIPVIGKYIGVANRHAPVG